jgi:hypothetical protein
VRQACSVTMSDPAELLLSQVVRVLGRGPFDPPEGWSHIGAVVCDASMQGGLRYEWVVFPKVKGLAEKWPDAVTTTRFRDRIMTGDLAATLGFANRQKLATVRALTDCLITIKVESVDDLRDWLDDPGSTGELLQIKGVGPKTASYLGTLVRKPSVAIDVHLRSFAADAKVPACSDAELQALYEQVADRLEVDRSGLDHAVWRYKSGSSRSELHGPGVSCRRGPG